MTSGALQVLFPLLTKLLENISPADPEGMEETRMRGATLLSKVILVSPCFQAYFKCGYCYEQCAIMILCGPKRDLETN